MSQRTGRIRRGTRDYQICGERSLTVRVTRHGAAGRFALSVVQP